GLRRRHGHGVDLFLREISELTRPQLPELERAHANAHQTRHLQTDGETHPTHLALPTGKQHERQARAAAGTRADLDAYHAGHAFLERDPALKACERLVGEVALDPGVVLAPVAVARMQHALGPGAVVGEQQQTFGVRVEPADRKEPLASADVIDDRAAAALVLRRRN